MLGRFNRPRKRVLFALVVAISLLSTSAAFAQGSIFGSVTNSNSTVPANGEISFFGYLDNTDEEIRIETSVGAGYDNGNWYDDFQNYLTEAPGNPYDYHFYNAGIGQGFVLSKLIPNNSFQQENITLQPVSWPGKAAGMTGRPISSSSVVISWEAVPGRTYHVYRRLATSDGSFFRIDAPTGSLANPGVSDSFFVDTGVDGVSSYDYLVIAQNVSGNLGPHSDILTVNSVVIQAPFVAAITPNTGFTVGGQSVTISGRNFDMTGAAALIGGSPLSSIVVVSPFEITGLTPAGVAGPANVTVTNIASGLASAPLTGGFTYQANIPPVLGPIGPQVVAEGGNLNFNATASDADGTIPALTTSTLPTNATFVDNGNGSGTFDFNPDFTQEGAINVTFYATDGIATDSEAVAITVTHTNQAPVLATIGGQTVAEAANLNFVVTAADADAGEIPAMTTSTLPANATFIDNGDGTGTFDFNPDFTQEGPHPVTFYASDGIATDSEVVTITVTNTNQAPVLNPIGNRSVIEGGNLNFGITSSDPDGNIPGLTTSILPANATFLDNGDGTGTFDFSPDFAQEGSYPVTFYASDGVATDSEVVTITVQGTNLDPVLDPIGAQTVAEGDNLNLTITASDPDATIPALTSSTPLPANATFVDNGDGTATFDFNPDFTQEGLLNITFYASDGIATDSEVVTITVTHVNQPPVLAAIGAQLVNEGSNLNFGVSATDGDGTIPTLTTSTLPANATFIDNGDGTGTLDFNPDFTQGGIIYPVTFYADDSEALDSEVVNITVNESGNQAPILDPIGPQTVAENANLTFGVTASDPDAFIPALTALNLPLGATFFDNLDGTGTFDFTPDFTQAGIFNITFIASDGLLADSEVVELTVTDVNREPILDPIGPQLVDEGANLNLTITASDLDGTIPALSVLLLPPNATFVDNLDGTGTFDFSPDFTQDGIINVTFYATDGIATDSEVVAITVNDGGNQAPVLSPIGPQVVYETMNLNLTITASDPDGDTPSLSALNLPPNATFFDNLDGTGTFDFTPSYNQAGDIAITFKAFDGILVDSEVVTVTVLNTNRPPVLTAIGAQSISEGATLSLNITAIDGDGTIPTLTTSTLPANATFVDNLNGSAAFDFTPDFTQNGVFNVTFYASDGADIDSEAVVIIVADAGNQAPIIDSIGPRIISEGTLLSINVTATDPDGFIPTLTAINLPPNATFLDNADGSGLFEFTPGFTQAGLYSVTFIANDGVLADSEVVLITVQELGNQAPVIDSIGPQTVYEGDTLVLDLSATDPEGHNITFNYSSTPAVNGITLIDNLDGTGTLTYIPGYTSSGTVTLRIYATDNGTPSLSGLEIVQVTILEVNQPPVIDSLGPFGVRVGKTLQFTVTATDSSAGPGNAIFLTVNGLPSNATFADHGDGTGTFSFTPVLSQVGVLTVRFIAIDNGVPPMSDQVDVVITVVATNAPPVIADVMPQMVLEGDFLSFNISATDPDGTIPTLTAQHVPANASFVDNGDGTGTFTFSPNFIQAGLYGIVFRAYDGVDVDKVTVLVQVVSAGNQIPNLFFIGPQQITENEMLTFTIGGDDPDSTIPNLAVDTLPDGAVFTDNNDGTATFTWTPTFVQAGDYYINFFATDGELADSEEVYIEVLEGPNQPPTLNPVTGRTVAENGTVLFTVTSSDLDGVPPLLTAAPLPGAATFTDNGDFTGTFLWYTGYYDAGEYDIVVTATDPDSADLVATITVHVTVTDVNQSPILWIPGGQTDDVNEGDTLVFTIMSEDPDSVAPIIKVTPVIQNFTLVNDGTGMATLTITPNYTQASSYTLNFYAIDGDPRYFDTAFVAPRTFDVINVPVAPVLNPIGAQAVTEGDTLDLFITAYHPGGGSVEIMYNNLPPNASVTGFGGTKRLVFTPGYTQAGLYTVLFYATDGTRADSEYVDITVAEAGNQPPQFVSTFPDTQIIAYGDLTSNHIVATDPDNDPLILTLFNPPANAVFVDSGNGAGSMVFTPDSTQVWGMFFFRFIATDPSAVADTMFKWVRVVAFLRGDANNDGGVNIADISHLISYVFRHGDAPAIMEAADVNFDDQVDLSDALYLVNFIFRHGPPPPN